MDAVGGDPEDGSALEREAAAGGDEVLQPLGGAIAAVGEQAVVGHADADVDGEEVHDEEGREILPGEEEERSDGADVEGAHGDGGDPVDAALLVLAAHAEVLLDLFADLDDEGEDAGGGGDGGLVGSLIGPLVGALGLRLVLNLVGRECLGGHIVSGASCIALFTLAAGERRRV